MSLTKTRKIALTGLAAVGVLAGSAGIANAVTSPSNPSVHSTATPAPATDPGSDSTGYTSSVKVPASLQLDSKSEAAADATLANLAKIDLGQATTAATKSVPGKAIEAGLDDEDGNLVYGVDVVTDKGTVEVIVDAGNGKILAHHAEHDYGDHADKGDHADSGATTTPGN